MDNNIFTFRPDDEDEDDALTTYMKGIEAALTCISSVLENMNIRLDLLTRVAVQQMDKQADGK